MSEEKVYVAQRIGEPDRLVRAYEKDMVGVDFGHLDNLIGSLCHIADLNSDRDYREHLKSEIKLRCRDWLRDQYERAEYKVI